MPRAGLPQHKSETFFTEIPFDELDSSETQPTTSTDAVDAVVKDEGYDKIYMFGEKDSGFTSTEPLQNYAKLRQYHLENKSLFLDQNFPTDTIELRNVSGKVEWKRPFEISKTPWFILDGATRFDVDQGQLGDCWFLAALANLTMNQKLFSLVVPEAQRFTVNYAGIFHFRFWQYGRWVDVVVDDRLPTVNNQLVYLRSSNRDEFWPPLLEKAFAKLYGGYENLVGGQVSEALEDLCGGLSEYYRANQVGIYDLMIMSHQRSSFMGCSIVSEETEGSRQDGLITTHAYSITDIRTVKSENSDVKLIRLRNPWGNDAEWNGPWSDRSKLWSLVSEQTRDELRVKRYDGEFWMDFDNFQRCFTFVDICHLNPSSFVDLDSNHKSWHVNMFEGSWVPAVTAGGGFKCTKTFANNPQYFFSIRGNQPNAKYALVVGLMQKNRRVKHADNLPMELNIFRVQKAAVGRLLDLCFFESNKPILSRVENGVRQLTVRVVLPAGTYCIIPSTVKPNQYASYLLRIYSETNANVREVDEEIGYSLDAVLNKPKQNDGVQDPRIHRLFKQISGGRKEIGWNSVREALNKTYAERRLFCFMKAKGAFSKNTCQNIVALWDCNYTGKLNCEEFAHLLEDIRMLKEIFKKFDEDNSGKLDGFELRNLLATCGYQVNNKILTILMLRYGSRGTISFENFVVCAYKLKTMIDEFHRRRTIEAGDNINVNRRDWLETILYS